MIPVEVPPEEKKNIVIKDIFRHRIKNFDGGSGINFSNHTEDSMMDIRENVWDCQYIENFKVRLLNQYIHHMLN
jgi:hypothetical protein